MSGRFAPGEKVFLTTGVEVVEARVERIRYGRYVISYSGSGYGAGGRICVSGNRLYRSCDEAAAHIRKYADTGSSGREPVQGRRTYRVDEPGDGWAMR